MTIGLKNQAASTYCIYRVLSPCRTASWKKLGRWKQVFQMGTFLTCCTACFATAMQKSAQQQAKEASEHFPVDHRRRKAAEVASSHLGSLWISGYCKDWSSPLGERNSSGLSDSQQQPPQRIACDLGRNTRNQSRRWSVIRERHRLACCVLSWWLGAPALTPGESAGLVHCSQSPWSFSYLQKPGMLGSRTENKSWHRYTCISMSKQRSFSSLVLQRMQKPFLPAPFPATVLWQVHRSLELQPEHCSVWSLLRGR